MRGQPCRRALQPAKRPAISLRLNVWRSPSWSANGFRCAALLFPRQIAAIRKRQSNAVLRATLL
jgi:hypothetical protein